MAVSSKGQKIMKMLQTEFMLETIAFSMQVVFGIGQNIISNKS